MLNSLGDKNKFRGPSSSEEFNAQVLNTKKDMELLYDLLNENEKTIYESTNITRNENFFLQRRIQALETELRKLNYSIESEKEQLLVYSNFYNSPNIKTQEDEPVLIDKEFGVAMPLPTDITNKLSHLTDSGRTVIPRDLEIVVEEENSQQFRSKELSDKMKDAGFQEDDIFTQTNQVPNKNFSRIVDGKRDTFWSREVVSNEKLELFGRVVIKTPFEGVTNLFSNTLKISPYPEGSMTIHSIMVKGLGNQWDLLENYPTKNNEPLPIENSGKLLFHFPRKEITEIIINFSQPYFLENNNERIFTYGFQGIGLEYRLFTEKKASFITEIDVANTGQFIEEVSTPQIVSAKGTSDDVDYLIEHKLYYDETLDTEFSFNTSILTPIDKVYIETSLKRDGEKVPVLKEIQIAYSLKEE